MAKACATKSASTWKFVVIASACGFPSSRPRRGQASENQQLAESILRSKQPPCGRRFGSATYFMDKCPGNIPEFDDFDEPEEAERQRRIHRLRKPSRRKRPVRAASGRSRRVFGV